MYQSKALAKRTRKSTQVDASQWKFAKPELAYGLAKGGQTDSQVGSQVAKSRTFHEYNWLIRFYYYLNPFNMIAHRLSRHRRLLGVDVRSG